jgi:hypothetical protein
VIQENLIHKQQQEPQSNSNDHYSSNNKNNNNNNNMSSTKKNCSEKKHSEVIREMHKTIKKVLLLLALTYLITMVYIYTLVIYTYMNNLFTCFLMIRSRQT